MQYHAPSIPAIECPPLVPDNTPVLICPSCGDTMQHLRTIRKLGARFISVGAIASGYCAMLISMPERRP